MLCIDMDVHLALSLSDDFDLCASSCVLLPRTFDDNWKTRLLGRNVDSCKRPAVFRLCIVLYFICVCEVLVPYLASASLKGNSNKPCDVQRSPTGATLRGNIK
jgi:hypothetical protein